MVGLIAFAVLGSVAAMALGGYRGLRRNIAIAKRSGIPYIVTPAVGIGYFWLFSIEFVVPILKKFEFTKSWDWVHVVGRDESWAHLRQAEEKYGDTWMLVSPVTIYVKTSNAELVNQIVTRRSDFPKPIDRYRIVDIFGKSMLTEEGQEWKRHRKVVGPSFSEKSNKLVFEESLRQAEGMLNLWSSQDKNTREDVTVKAPAKDIANLSLHVICAAGFGVPQLWPGESEEKLDGRGLPGFSTYDLENGHTMTLKLSLNNLLHSLIWFALLPPWLIKYSFFQVHKDLYQSFKECGMYFKELVQIKKKQMQLGETDKGTMDLMGPMIKASDEAPSDIKSSGPHTPVLTRDELIGNSFIFLFAGHETSANGIHFTIINLAISLPDQRHMQRDIDAIVGRDKPASEWSYLTDMPRLYNSMVGAAFSEVLRLMPAIPNIPKSSHGDQAVTVDGKQWIIPHNSFLHLNCIGTNRNPRYWPQSPSKISGKEHDMDDFVPERWLPKHSNAPAEQSHVAEKKHEEADGLEKASFETSNAASLLKPVKGAFISFSEGARACPGRRFAQVEITAVLAAIFQKYSVELDVADFASDEEVARMSRAERKIVYDKAIERARVLLQRSEQTITLQLKRGDNIPVRFVERGRERFADIY